jgi:hypothetical protein
MGKPSKPPIYPGLAKQLRKIPFHEIPTTLFKGPPKSRSIKVKCDCGHQFAPPWAKKLDFEHAPIQSKDGAVWVFAGVPLPCPKCGNKVEFHFPESQQRGRIHLYGDEAGDWFGPGYFHVYAFAGLPNSYRDRIGHALLRAKSKIRPGADPTKWGWHTWEIRNSRWRKKHNVEISIEETNEEIRRLASELNVDPKSRVLSSVIFPPVKISNPSLTRKRIQAEARDQTLTAALMGLTEFCTRNGFSPRFTLEAQTTAHGTNQIDYFVERIGRGLHHDLGFHYVCRGKNVGIPETAPKASCIELEIADLIAFATRRFFYAENCGFKTEIPLELFGEIYWGAFAAGGFGTTTAIGFPAEYFFAGPPQQ